MDSMAVINTSKSTAIDLSKNASITNSGCNRTVCISNAERVIWGCFLAIITTASLLGNSVVIYTVLKKNQFRNRRFAFLLLLIISDFTTAIVMMPLYFANLILENVFETSNQTCFLVAIIFTFIIALSYLCITLLALERYIMLKYPIKNRRCFTKPVATGIISVVVLMSMISVLTPILRSLPVIYHEKLHICIFDMRGKTKLETHFNVIIRCAFLGTLWFILLIYCSVGVVAIIWKRRHSSTQINPEVSAESSTTTSRCTHSLRQHSREIRSTIRILSAFVAFGCCLPSTIGYVCDTLGYHWSERSLMATMFIFYCKSALNPLINAFLHTQLRQYLVKVLYCKFQT